MANAVSRVCRDLGAGPVVCATGSAGRSEMDRNVFGLIILDLGLPDMSGWDVFKAAQERDSKRPVLIITGQGTLKNAIRAQQSGARSYLVKPFDLDDLEKAVRDLLHREDEAEPPSDAEESEEFLGGANARMQKVFKSIAQADSTDAPVLLSCSHQAARRSQIARDRLLNQHVDSRFQQHAAHFGMERSRHRYHGCINVALQLAERRERKAVVLSGGLRGALGIRVHDTH